MHAPPARRTLLATRATSDAPYRQACVSCSDEPVFGSLISKPREPMPRRKQARRTSVRDILRLTHKQGSPVGQVAEQLRFGKTSASTYLRALETGCRAGPACGFEDDAMLKHRLLGRIGRRPHVGSSSGSRQLPGVKSKPWSAIPTRVGRQR